MSAAMEPRFVITGCRRSGTVYSSTLLSKLGVPCGHETIFFPSALLDRTSLDWPTTWLGDASWLAAPYLKNLPPSTLVLHQVRDPLAVIRSLMRTKFFEQPSAYRRFAELHEPGLENGTALERAMHYWTAWNLLTERASEVEHLRYRRYRLEDLDQTFLVELLDEIGRPVPDDLDAVFASVPSDTNSEGSKEHDAEIRWDTLPTGPVADELIELAERYGYRCSRSEADEATQASR